MRFSLSWIRQLLPLEADASAVAEALTSRGLPVDAAEARGPDTVLEVDVPANRPDCLGHLGIARELAAAFDLKPKPRPAAPRTSGAPVEREVAVRVEDEGLCPRYTARLVRRVRVGPSPGWVVSRLEACGLRSVNNVVDASNLVLLELGHPIHAFDLARLTGPAIVVRRAREAESLVTLDGLERRLEPSMLVIADASQPVAVAGVIGGADSEIRETTRDVLIEAAWFEPRQVRRTARRLGLVTEASHRFERGVDPEGVVDAQETAARLLHELAGGAPAPGLLDLYPSPRPPRRLSVRLERMRLLLGYDAGSNAAERALRTLGFDPRREGTVLHVTVPSWRVDVEREADLVEEVARHLGYDLVPGRAPILAPPTASGVVAASEERTRDILAHLGFHEALSYVMIGPGEDDPFVAPDAPPQLSLANPLGEALGRLRRSLAVGLLRAVDGNLRRGVRDVRLFEVGRVFLSRGDGGFPREPSRVGLAWSGAAEPRHWSRKPREADLYDAAGVVESLIEGHRPGLALNRSGSGLPGLHPGRSLAWVPAAGDVVAWCGEIHPDLRDRFDIKENVLLAEVDLDALAAVPRPTPRYHPISRFPAVTRDLSFVLAPGTTYERVLEVLRAVPAPDAVEFEIVDRYEGEPLAPGEVSLTVRLVLQPLSRTLTDEETEAFRLALVRALEREAGARLRG